MQQGLEPLQHLPTQWLLAGPWREVDDVCKNRCLAAAVIAQALAADAQQVFRRLAGRNT